MAKKKPESIVEAIMKVAKDRFIVEREDEQTSELIDLAPDSIQKKSVLRLQRKLTGTHGRRTLLIAELPTSNEIDLALEWSAACKDVLLDPESSDLYLFITLLNHDYTIEQCISVEANEKFCRKFIQRPNESNEELIERTFLLSIADNSTRQAIQDPLTAAFSLTGDEVDWFNKSLQDEWRKKLLSGKSGNELIELLFGNRPEKNSE